jgi:hypothetical protein
MATRPWAVAYRAGYAVARGLSVGRQLLVVAIDVDVGRLFCRVAFAHVGKEVLVR